ncbi:hypothetical protein [Paraburkholderia unamae]|uniref:hypothetical protein n=1 Tax=Paraburkholderia unamae TaxID=219649 RepID=UPI0011BFA404|nr:hypothetical protein [Paraburkholderia unamae]
MQRQFPGGYARDELGSEIARLNLLLERQLAFRECMSLLADRIEQVATDQHRQKATRCLLDLVRSAAETFLEQLPEVSAAA